MKIRPWAVIACLDAVTAWVFLGSAGCEPRSNARSAARPEEIGRASKGLVVLEFELPKPAFPGTPKNVPVGTTVQKPTGKPRPPYKAPAGVKLVSLEKPVTSSDPEPIIGELECITDGDKEAKDGSYVELGPGKQWAQVDLEEPCEIYAILFWNYHGDPRVYHDVVVQVADDPDFITNVRTLFNNDHDNSSGLGTGDDYEYFELYEGKLIKLDGLEARYVRIYTNGSTADDMNRFTEIEVYGLLDAAGGEL
jgi:hypothetical protein